MKRLSLQWRITIMTALLTCAACVLTNCLVGYTGMRYMEAIGSDISAFNATGENSPQAFDPTKATLDDEVTIVVNDAQESFGTTAWRITAGVTLLGGVLAYFVSGRALKPLRAFAAQVERVQPDNLSEIKLGKDVPTELQRCSASFNDMIVRLDEGFSAQRQFTGNAAHELRTPLALVQAQIELFVSERSNLQPETAELLGLLQEQTERMSRMTKVLLEMSELRSVPCEDDVELGPLSEEVLTDLRICAEDEVLAGIQDAQRKLTAENPDRVVTVGGNCMASLALFDYLHGKYENVGIVWIYAHPDVSTLNDGYPNAHAMVLGNLLEQGAPQLVSRMRHPVFKPSDVLHVGLQQLHDYQEVCLNKHRCCGFSRCPHGGKRHAGSV